MDIVIEISLILHYHGINSRLAIGFHSIYIKNNAINFEEWFSRRSALKPVTVTYRQARLASRAQTSSGHPRKQIEGTTNWLSGRFAAHLGLQPTCGKTSPRLRGCKHGIEGFDHTDRYTLVVRPCDCTIPAVRTLRCSSGHCTQHRVQVILIRTSWFRGYIGCSTPTKSPDTSPSNTASSKRTSAPRQPNYIHALLKFEHQHTLVHARVMLSLHAKLTTGLG